MRSLFPLARQLTNLQTFAKATHFFSPTVRTELGYSLCNPEK